MDWPVNWMHMQLTIPILDCRHLPILAFSRTYTSTCHHPTPALAKSFVAHVLCSCEGVYSPGGIQAYVLYVIAGVERVSHRGVVPVSCLILRASPGQLQAEI
jgi:hypothetical protein